MSFIIRPRFRCLRCLLHHRRHVRRAGIHQFHGLRHGPGQCLVGGKRLDLLFPQIGVFPRQTLQVFARLFRITVRPAVFTHDIGSHFIEHRVSAHWFSFPPTLYIAQYIAAESIGKRRARGQVKARIFVRRRVPYAAQCCTCRKTCGFFVAVHKHQR